MKTLLLTSCLLLFGTGFTQSLPSNSEEARVPAYTLPDPLVRPNGKKVSTAAQWKRRQRPFVYHLYEQVQFGRYPRAKTPLSFRLREEGDAFGGRATRRQVRLFLHPADTSVFLDVLFYIPKGVSGPVPVFTAYNFCGNHTVADDPHLFLGESWVYGKAKGVVNNRATDSARGTDAAQWDIGQVLAHGFALATAYYGDIEPDQAEGWKTGIRTTLKDILKIQADEWGAMGAWAWGLSRIMDYLQQDKTFDAGRVAVMGHSRLGKAALWAAASDPRFALAVSNESGEGGAALSKRFFGETVKIITTRFPYWFGPNFKNFADNTAALPVDGHMLLSLVAPRPLYVASAEGDTWSDPLGEFLSAREAGRVYALFGKKGPEGDHLPPLHQPVGETPRYHIRAGRHDVQPYDWQQYLQFADGFWKK
ncbi:hypothetical protein V9K67_25830 [Paraflavisolibacter sp. H34]|uniref:glucuronyl esterase domain-containing protein n=1 Tax=Huijunlia imazamoxiresistens TaxID=3127457 RepID=UPI003017AF05